MWLAIYVLITVGLVLVTNIYTWYQLSKSFNADIYAIRELHQQQISEIEYERDADERERSIYEHRTLCRSAL